MTTIRDVARAANVSVATVSRVINGKTVDPILAARTREVIESMGYQPSRAARTLRRRQSQVLALVVSDIRNPFYTEMVRGIEDVAYESGYSVVLCNTDEDVAKETAYLELALAEQVAGIVLAPARPRSRHLAKVLANKVPIVTVNGRLNAYELDRVLANNAFGAEQAALHLIDSGYTRLACLTGSSGTTTAEERLAGFRAGLERHGLVLDPQLVRHGDFREAGGYDEMRALLALDAPPDAVFVANNRMTLGALRALSEAGTRVPDDMGIVGFDDDPWAPLVNPPLTTVAQPTYDLGLETARLLLSRIEGYTGSAREVVLSPTLHVRMSSQR